MLFVVRRYETQKLIVAVSNDTKLFDNFVFTLIVHGFVFALSILYLVDGGGDGDGGVVIPMDAQFLAFVRWNKRHKRNTGTNSSKVR